jgi:ribosomal protein S18 acetylase RimI-like enzyme
MYVIRKMKINEVDKLKEIDRSERIELIYRFREGTLEEIKAGHDCPNWDQGILNENMGRFTYELSNGGTAYGAYDQERLVGFGVLGHKFRGENNDQLQIDLMYVSNSFRRKGIASSIMDELSKAAKSRGAKYLYISSTETESAVNFYRSCGSQITDEVDKELFEKEPEDIHMLKRL